MKKFPSIEQLRSIVRTVKTQHDYQGKDGYITPEDVKNKIRNSNLRITESGKTVAEETYIKRTNSILLNNPDGLKDIGIKSGLTQKINGTHKGSNNANASIIEIFDSNDNLIVRCNGNFKEKCKELGLPCRVLIQSYQRGGIPIYSKEKTPKKLTNNIYKGWYAIKK